MLFFNKQSSCVSMNTILWKTAIIKTSSKHELSIDQSMQKVFCFSLLGMIVRVGTLSKEVSKETQHNFTIRLLLGGLSWNWKEHNRKQNCKNFLKFSVFHILFLISYTNIPDMFGAKLLRIGSYGIAESSFSSHFSLPPSSLFRFVFLYLFLTWSCFYHSNLARFASMCLIRHVLSSMS